MKKDRKRISQFIQNSSSIVDTKYKCEYTGHSGDHTLDAIYSIKGMISTMSCIFTFILGIHNGRGILNKLAYSFSVFFHLPSKMCFITLDNIN